MKHAVYNNKEVSQTRQKRDTQLEETEHIIKVSIG